MNKHAYINRLSLLFTLLIIVIVGLVLFNSLQRTAYITLPSDSGDTTTETQTTQTTVNSVSVTTDTVQDIIASLSRSDYRRTLRIEQFWSSGSGSREVIVTQQGDFQHLEETLTEGRIQHTITTTDTFYQWFEDDSDSLYQSPLGDFTIDQLQGIPTYEDVLSLSKSEIQEAYYESLSGVRCVYVQSQSGDYTNRYWISVDNGLLVAAERLEGEDTIYRMAVVKEETLSSDDTYFLLPDGTDLLIG